MSAVKSPPSFGQQLLRASHLVIGLFVDDEDAPTTAKPATPKKIVIAISKGNVNTAIDAEFEEGSKPR